MLPRLPEEHEYFGISATNILGQVGTDEAVTTLRGLVRNEALHLNIRMSAFENLGKLKRMNVDVVNVVKDMLKDEDLKGRALRRIAKIHSKIPKTKFFKPLIDMMSEIKDKEQKHSNVWWDAENALNVLKSVSPPPMSSQLVADGPLASKARTTAANLGVFSQRIEKDAAIYVLLYSLGYDMERENDKSIAETMLQEAVESSFLKYDARHETYTVERAMLEFVDGPLEASVLAQVGFLKYMARRLLWAVTMCIKWPETGHSLIQEEYSDFEKLLKYDFSKLLLQDDLFYFAALMKGPKYEDIVTKKFPDSKLALANLQKLASY
jgi:hypothetical protein